MQFTSNLLVSTIALFAMVQYCPAPFIFVGMTVAEVVGSVSGVVGAVSGVASAVEGGISAHGKREDTEEIHFDTGRFSSRVMRRQAVSALGLGTAWPDCKSELGTVTVRFSSPSAGTVVVENVPPACMTLCGVITGKYDEGNPVPMSSNSIKFTNLTPDDINQIQAALDAHPNHTN